jgi:hypothetical protein
MSPSQNTVVTLAEDTPDGGEHVWQVMVPRGWSNWETAVKAVIKMFPNIDVVELQAI